MNFFFQKNIFSAINNPINGCAMVFMEFSSNTVYLFTLNESICKLGDIERIHHIVSQNDLFAMRFETVLLLSLLHSHISPFLCYSLTSKHVTHTAVEYLSTKSRAQTTIYLKIHRKKFKSEKLSYFFLKKSPYKETKEKITGSKCVQKK